MRELNIIKQSIATLRDNERTSKELITVLAVETMQRLHEHDDVDTLNLFILALSDANRKMVVSFTKHFAGHKIGEDTVGRRVKPFLRDGETVDAYQVAKDAFATWCESGQNIWQWAFSKKETVEKPVDIAKLGEQFRKKAQKAIAAGASKLSVFHSVTDGLFTAQEMLEMLSAMMDAADAADKAMAKAQAKVAVAQATA